MVSASRLTRGPLVFASRLFHALVLIVVTLSGLCPSTSHAIDALVQQRALVFNHLATEDQMRLLSDLGCDFGQGYYFQAATPVRDIDACFKNGLPLGRAFTD